MHVGTSAPPLRRKQAISMVQIIPLLALRELGKGWTIPAILFCWMDAMMRSRFAVLGIVAAIPVTFALWALSAHSQETNAAALSTTAKPGEWRHLNADPLSTRYSPL